MCCPLGDGKRGGNQPSIDLGAAGAAVGDISACKFEQVLLPGWLWKRVFERKTGCGLPASIRWDSGGQMTFGLGQALGGGVEARVANLFETVRQHMLDKALEENDRVDGDRLSVLRPEGDFVLGHVQET